MAIPAIVQATIDELSQLAAPLRTSTNEVARNLAAQIDALIERVEAGDPDVDLGSVGIILGAGNGFSSNVNEFDGLGRDEAIAAARDGLGVEATAELHQALTEMVNAAEELTDDEDEIAQDLADDEDDDEFYDEDDEFYDDEDVIVPMAITTPDVTLTDALADDLVANIDQFLNATGSEAAVATNGPRDLARGVLIEVTNPGTQSAAGSETTIGFIDTTNHGVVKVSITDANAPAEDQPVQSILDRAAARAADLDELVEIGEADPVAEDRLSLRLIADDETITNTQVNAIVDRMGPALAMLGDIVVDGDTVIDGSVATVPLRVNAHAPGRPALALHNGMGGRGGDTVDGIDITVEIVGVTA